MSFLESAKQYTGSDLETIFFRPILSGDSARELGVRVLYNMPVPTTIQLWDGQRNVLQKYSAAGWTGGNAATKLQKTISLGRVKAELGFSAADYFSLVYEKIAARADVNMDDLTGTELEQAETALFKQAVAESIRATMWVGDTSAASGYNTFDGFLKTVKAGAMQEKFYNSICQAEDFSDPGKVVAVLDDLWMNADERVKDMKADGQLAFFVTSDIYYAFEKYLDGKSTAAAPAVEAPVVETASATEASAAPSALKGKDLRVLVLCAGAGTSALLANALKEGADELGIDITANAGAYGSHYAIMDQYNVIVLAPQVRTYYNEMKADTDRLGITLLSPKGKQYIDLTKDPKGAVAWIEENLEA